MRGNKAQTDIDKRSNLSETCGEEKDANDTKQWERRLANLNTESITVINGVCIVDSVSWNHSQIVLLTGSHAALVPYVWVLHGGRPRIL